MATLNVCRCFRFLSVSSAILKPKHWQINQNSVKMVRHLSVTQYLRDNKRRYAKSHEWASLSGNVAKVGITDYAQDKLGEVVYVDFPEIGNELGKEDIYGALESVKAAADLYSPLSGKVKSINEQLTSSPQIVNESPTDRGWIIELDVSNIKEYDELMTEKEYNTFIEENN